MFTDAVQTRCDILILIFQKSIRSRIHSRTDIILSRDTLTQTHAHDYGHTYGTAFNTGFWVFKFSFFVFLSGCEWEKLSFFPLCCSRETRSLISIFYIRSSITLYARVHMDRTDRNNRIFCLQNDITSLSARHNNNYFMRLKKKKRFFSARQLYNILILSRVE